MSVSVSVCVLEGLLNHHKLGEKQMLPYLLGKVPRPNGHLIFPHLPQSSAAAKHT